MRKAKEILESLNKLSEEQTTFKVGDFVYDTYGVDPGFGLIKEINGDTAIVSIYRTKYGAISGAGDRTTKVRNLYDGNAIIDNEIAKLERKIQAQKDIRNEIVGMTQKGM